MSLLSSIEIRKKQRLFPVISEIKCRSQKMGDLLKGRNPLKLLKKMETCSVAGISVVTESEYFGGSMDLLKKIASLTSLPVLHKDFIKDEEQIKESKKIGASSILLIASMLSEKELEVLVETAKRVQIETLVEVHTLEDVVLIKNLECDMIGINNRDIKILETDNSGVEVTESIIKRLPKRKPIISESGIMGRDDAIRAKKAGADAILVGTAVMLADNIKRFLNELIQIGWSE